MKTVMMILHLLNGEVAKVPVALAIGEWCSDKVDEHTQFVKNPNYKEGNGEVWIHRKYKDKIVWAHYCKTKDGKHFVHYNDGKPIK